ncbi:hypothetical protein AX17_002599 [Amanita inopinata Kibby_2008]|nr:hypothetical protein AX17_002599 [Amanita inopinata Kibby_2008]
MQTDNRMYSDFFTSGLRAMANSANLVRCCYQSAPKSVVVHSADGSSSSSTSSSSKGRRKLGISRSGLLSSALCSTFNTVKDAAHHVTSQRRRSSLTSTGRWFDFDRASRRSSASTQSGHSTATESESDSDADADGDADTESFDEKSDLWLVDTDGSSDTASLRTDDGVDGDVPFVPFSDDRFCKPHFIDLPDDPKHHHHHHHHHHQQQQQQQDPPAAPSLKREPSLSVTPPTPTSTPATAPAIAPDGKPHTAFHHLPHYILNSRERQRRRPTSVQTIPPVGSTHATSTSTSTLNPNPNPGVSVSVRSRPSSFQCWPVPPPLPLPLPAADSFCVWWEASPFSPPLPKGEEEEVGPALIDWRQFHAELLYEEEEEDSEIGDD